MAGRPHRALVFAMALVMGVGGCATYRRTVEPNERPAPTQADSASSSSGQPAPEPALMPVEQGGAAPGESQPPGEEPPPTPPQEPADLESRAPSFQQVFPGIRIDATRKIVEFDASVSPLIFAPYEGRFFYLETFVCKAGTKDHESLVVTTAVPSQIHAALLLIGLEPGRPAYWEHPEGVPVARPATGPRVNVQFVLGEGGGDERVVDPRQWTKAKVGQAPFPGGDWVFAGSAMKGAQGAEFYEADSAGTIVGLASFGTEVISWPRVISAEEADEQLEWVADLEAIPAADTPVVVRVTAAP